jgi:hypothetical protein
MKNIIILTIILFLVNSCTEIGEPTIHPNNWIDPSSENSHMTKITVSGTEGCKSCHGDDYSGGTSDVSCHQCHAGGISGHPATSIWVGSPDSPNFHGKEDLERCKTCHGDDYLGGTSDVSCYQCHAGGISGHPATSIWVGSPNSPNFHGKEDVERCKVCHGDDYLGGTSGVSCYQCHNGPGYGCQDFTSPPSSHTQLLEDDDCDALHMPGFEDPSDNGCATCHGTDLTGGYGPSCYICHGNRWDGG